MANVLARRFSLATNSFLEGFKNSSKNENTTKSTRLW